MRLTAKTYAAALAVAEARHASELKIAQEAGANIRKQASERLRLATDQLALAKARCALLERVLSLVEVVAGTRKVGAGDAHPFAADRWASPPRTANWGG